MSDLASTIFSVVMVGHSLFGTTGPDMLDAALSETSAQVEVREQIGDLGLGLAPPGSIAFQPLDDRARVDLLLNVNGGRIDIEIGRVLGIFAPPDELRIKVGIARIAQLDRPRLILLHKALLLGRGDHGALGGVVLVVFDVLRCGTLFDHLIQSLLTRILLGSVLGSLVDLNSS